ncbi:sensor histidine kinase [Paraclostridium bifermentans]|uniref:sensor histidine kinase n=1 Tax=Paraclostridium bifermentans TaxID=1490 RepID=UPI00359C2A71
MKSNCFEENALELSPIPYVFGELIKIENEKYSFIVKSVNNSFEEILDINRKELINKDIYEILGIDDITEKLEWVVEGKNKTINLKKVKKSYELISKHINENKYSIWFIDKNKELEYEKTNKIRNEFFTNLSHELRTPLNLIFSSLQVLDLKIKNTNVSEEQFISKYINMANQNTYRLLKLVNNIIDSNKITSGYFDHNPQNYDIINFIEGICMSVVDFASHKNIDIVFDTEMEEKVISFDLDQMERIILNLLSNAIKFSKDNGKIKIYIKEENNMIEISISDNGIGIPKHKLESVFDRFKQVDNNVIRRGEGSGIGLYLVKCLIDMHGGSIHADSELDIGTTFKIRIPDKMDNECEYTIIEKNLQNSYIEKIKVEFSDIYA